MFISTLRAASLLSISSLLCSSVLAYDVDTNSCQGADSQYVQNAMADAQAMASAGQSQVTADPQNGNSRLLMWKEGSDYQQVADNLGSMLGGVDWSFSVGSSPLIYCNENGFVQVPGSNRWKDASRGLVISTKKSALCGTGNLATTYRGAKLRVNPGRISSMIMLCDVRPGGEGQSPDTSGNVAALADVESQQYAPNDPSKPPGDGVKGFYPGKNMDRIAGYWLLSFSLVHELMHVTQPVAITSGSAEIYGWNRCSGQRGQRTGAPGITDFAAAIVNADTYAYWSLSAYVESTSGYDVFDGEMFVPPSLPDSRIKRGSYASKRNFTIGGNGRKPGERDLFFLWD